VRARARLAALGGVAGANAAARAGIWIRCARGEGRGERECRSGVGAAPAPARAAACRNGTGAAGTMDLAGARGGRQVGLGSGWTRPPGWVRGTCLPGQVGGLVVAARLGPVGGARGPPALPAVRPKREMEEGFWGGMWWAEGLG